jgi:hypothetical protein
LWEKERVWFCFANRKKKECFEYTPCVFGLSGHSKRISLGAEKKCVGVKYASDNNNEDGN